MALTPEEIAAMARDRHRETPTPFEAAMMARAAAQGSASARAWLADWDARSVAGWEARIRAEAGE